MEYKTRNFNIYGYKTNKFKTILVRILFLANVSKKDFILSELLLAILTYTNNNYHTNREYNMALQDLYDLYISSNSNRRGNKIMSTIELNMIDPKYTSKKIMKDSIKMLSESIFNPYIVDNHFDTNSFNIIKEQFKSFIDGMYDNPQALINDEVLSSYSDFNIGVTYKEARKYLEEIDEYGLYEYYKEFINKREISIYVCGDYDDSLINLLAKFPFKSKNIDFIDNKIINEKQKDTVIYKDYNQAKLAMLLKYDNITEFERKYVSTILNSILGGLQDSLLMESIREEESLVYYIDSLSFKYDQTMVIYSGCSSSNIDLVLKKIDSCIKLLSKGDFSLDKLNAAIMDVTVVLEDYERSPYLILDSLVSQNYLNKDDLATRIKNYKKVTKEDVMNLAKKLKTMKIALLRDKNERD